MSTRQLLQIAVVGVVGGLLIGLYLYWHSPERRINSRLDQLEELMEKSGVEGQLATVARAREVVKVFAPGFVVRAEPYEGQLTDATELAGAVIRYRNSAEKISVSFSDRDLEVRPNRTAQQHFVAQVKMDFGAGAAGREGYRVRIGWREDDGEWTIQSLEVLEVLEGGNLLGL